MALSQREILLVLRARDEATRTMHRVSAAMTGMDKRAATSSAAMINTQKEVLRGLTSQLGTVNDQYARTIANAYAVHRRQQDATNEQYAVVRNQIRGVQDEFTRLSRVQQDMYAKNRIDAATYRKNMTDLRRLREDQLRQLYIEKDAIADNARANSEAYHRRVIDARQLHNTQKENIRLERENAKEIIRVQQELQDADRIRRANLIDQGHRLTAIGSQALFVGASMTYMGGAGVYAFAQTTKSAIEYEQAARRTLTQVDDNRIKLNQVADAGKRIADIVPVAFEEIQPAMYDVFSSIDVNMRQATKLTKQFSKDAVGGTTEVATATRANLAIMNAYGIKVKDVTEVSDFMFQLVRKGVGSYEEFAKTIGRAIPSARRAGQSYKTLGGMLAFMTRNGVSAAMAATSSARALDALSHPVTIDRLEEMGINVKNMRGEFLPLPKILDKMNDKFGKMTTPQRAKALKDLFSGSGGTIQARRFFDMYFKNADEFNQRVKEMQNNAGEAKRAFETMAESPQAKIQALKNDWMLLRIEIGEHLMPIAMRVVETLNSWIDAFQRLSPEQRKTIAQIGLMVAAGTAILGVLTMMGGAILIVVGSVKMLGLTMGAAAGKLGFLSIGLVGIVTGLGKIVTASSDAERAMGIFLTTAGGAIAGFAIGGPIGAAIGGVVGLLGGLGAAAASSGDSARNSISDWDALKDTLNQVSGATTQATRTMIYDEAQRSGLFDKLKNENLTRREIVDGIMGETNARNRLLGIVVQHRQKVEGLRAELARVQELQQRAATNENVDGISSRTAKYAEQQKEIKKQIAAYEALIKSIEGGVGTLEKEAEEMRKRSAATTDFSAIARKVPKRVITEFKNANLPGNIKQLAEFSNKLKLTPKQVKTVMQFLGIEGNIKQLQNLRNKMKEVDKTPARMNDFITGVERGARNAERSAQRGATNIKNTLQKETGKAKANLAPFTNSVQSGVQPAIAAAGSGGNAVGNSLKQGMIAGFSGTAAVLAAQAAAAVYQAVSAARAAAKAKSPSRETMAVGKDLGDGLVIGWRMSVKPLEKDEPSKLVRRLINELLKEMATTAPRLSTLMDQARDLIEKKFDRQRNAIERGIKKQKDAIRKFNDATKGTKNDKRLGGVGEGRLDAFDRTRNKRMKSMLKEIREETEKDWKRLQTVTEKYRAKVKELETARNTLESMKAEKASYISSLASGLAQFRGMADIQGDEIMESVLDRGRIVQRGTGQYKPPTLNQIVAGFAAKLNHIRQYGALIGKLRGMGYSAAVIDQVLQMGPEQGYQYAQALVQATGAQVQQINAYDAGITTTANTIAAEAGGHMYDVGIAMQQGIVDGLQADVEKLAERARNIARRIEEAMLEIIGVQKAVKRGKEVGEGIAQGLKDKEDRVGNGARRLARAIVTNFNEELKIKSPSRVGIDIGRNFGGAVGSGLLREEQTVSKAAMLLAKAMEYAEAPSDYRAPQPRQYGPGGGNTYNQQIDITTQELDPKRHAAVIGWELAARGL